MLYRELKWSDGTLSYGVFINQAIIIQLPWSHPSTVRQVTRAMFN